MLKKGVIKEMSALEELVDRNINPCIKKSRDNFWNFCNTLYPRFYKKDRDFLIEFCNMLQAFYENRVIKLKDKKEWIIVSETEKKKLKDYIICEKLMVNIPPRHGKSFTATNFSKWILGKNNENKIITVSYNETLSGRFAKQVRDGIEEKKVEKDKIVFKDIFPKTNIKQGDGATQLWSLEGQFFNYLATSPTGTVTGVGCNFGIIDDIIKSKYEAYNDNILENHWDWYVNTFLSRLEEGAKQIVIMTRWSSKDLCGKLLEQEGDEWYVFKRKAYDEKNNKMLCPSLLSLKSYNDKKSKTDIDIVEANYNQNPIDLKNQLYTSFKTYTDYPRDRNGNIAFEKILSCTDTADEGNDYLCSIIFGVFNKEAYVLDIIYTKEPMEKTEGMVAKALFENKASLANIESNNGGKGFARSVERILREKYNSNYTRIKWFHQSQNKKARILSNATWVMEHIYYPANFKDRWNEYYKAMASYQSEGKNKNDDAPDCTTQICELLCGMRNAARTINKSALGI